MTHQDFQKARENMVLSQLQPSGIVSERVMEAYRAVPREMFVPNPLRGVSYLDDDIPLGHSRVMMEPLLHALMVQDAELQPSDKCLDIGAGTGYSAAVLAQLTDRVIALDQEEKLLQDANNHWQTLGVSDKITAIVGDHIGGYISGEPYKFIFINGAVTQISHILLSQLSEDGVLYGVLMPEDALIGKVVAVRRDEHGHISQKILGEGVTSYLPGFQPKNTFTF
ncbi:MAG: protein-L-isoaspartate O-methyltransferase [Alphaproteobacteria bacterium]|nr:protein-L-isoaspartate O-methyltransferase [Alphaproteobacteria bacterium]